MTAKDNNGIDLMLVAWNADDTVALPLKADPTSHRLQTSDGTSGSDLGSKRAARSENAVTTLLALSSDDDGVIVPLYTNSSGELLIDSS